MARFEKVSAYADIEFDMPERKTEGSAGYDMVVAQDTVIPPYRDLLATMRNAVKPGKEYTLDEVATLTKNLKTRPTLVPTGVKCKLAKNEHLELHIRSSSPLKHWLMLANSVGKLS